MVALIQRDDPPVAVLYQHPVDPDLMPGGLVNVIEPSGTLPPPARPFGPSSLTPAPRLDGRFADFAGPFRAAFFAFAGRFAFADFFALPADFFDFAIVPSLRVRS